MQQRESLSSRLGFLLISAGCAIGLGNVWRFPYIVGKYGGGAFVLLYLFFLVTLALPIMVMEFSVGRASRKSAAASFRVLEKKGTKWHWFSAVAVAGNYLLMMFYTVVAGWMLLYFFKMLRGDFVGMDTAGVDQVFSTMTGDAGTVVLWMVIVIVLGLAVCARGVKKGVEKVTKVMMLCLLAVLTVLVIRAVTLPGAGEGLSFYLKPDFGKLVENGFGETVFAAMGQAFFTLSIGIGSMAIFGSYIGKERSLTGESICVAGLDTFVAFMSGLIIFPSCFAFGIEPTSGPKLIFVTLPNVFNTMPGGRFWGALFFLFMSFAAFSTVIAVFENILSFGMDLFGWSRKKSVWINLFLITILSLPCALGFNLWSGFQPFGAGSNILDLEDFILSNNLLPLGSMVYLLFCTTRYGWGWDNFIEEANTGVGMRVPKHLRFYLTYILPLIVALIFLQGYLSKFF